MLILKKSLKEDIPLWQEKWKPWTVTLQPHGLPMRLQMLLQSILSHHLPLWLMKLTSTLPPVRKTCLVKRFVLPRCSPKPVLPVRFTAPWQPVRWPPPTPLLKVCSSWFRICIKWLVSCCRALSTFPLVPLQVMRCPSSAITPTSTPAVRQVMQCWLPTTRRKLWT